MLLRRQSQVAESSRRYLLRIPDEMHLGSFPLLELLLSQGIPARNSRWLLYLLVFTPWDPDRCVVVELFPIKSVIVTRSSCAEKLQIVVSPRSYFLRTKLGWSCQHLLEVYCHRKLPRGAVAVLSVSLCWYFLRLPTAADLISYPLFELFLSQKAPARNSRRLLCLLVSTSWDTQPGWS